MTELQNLLQCGYVLICEFRSGPIHVCVACTSDVHASQDMMPRMQHDRLFLMVIRL